MTRGAYIGNGHGHHGHGGWGWYGPWVGAGGHGGGGHGGGGHGGGHGGHGGHNGHGGHDHGGDHDGRGWWSGWGGWGGWGWPGYAFGYGGYPGVIDVPAGRVLGPTVLLGQEAGPPAAAPFPPRAALVEAPAPTQANRDILPMSTGVPILPTQSAQITGRPQTIAYKIGCYKISNAGTAGGAADWIVNDIKIGNRSQFVQSGDVPGDVFATNAIDTFVRFETAQTAMDVVVVVTYIGLNESGCPFFSAMIGTAAV